MATCKDCGFPEDSFKHKKALAKGFGGHAPQSPRTAVKKPVTRGRR